jgi:hypothetical protein
LNTRATNVPFENSASPQERQRVLKQDIDALRRAVSPDTGPAVPVWPRLPAGPWAGADPLGVEPVLGIDINAMSKEQRR